MPCPLDAGAVIITGTDTGRVTVGVSVVDSEPEFSLAGWEEAVDVSVHAPEGQLFVDTYFVDSPSLPLLSPTGPGWYRVRCLERGRLTELDTNSLESTEEHQLIVWPAPPGPEKVHHIALRSDDPDPMRYRAGRPLTEPNRRAGFDHPNG